MPNVGRGICFFLQLSAISLEKILKMVYNMVRIYSVVPPSEAGK